MNLFPYTNFHDLNLDWLLQQLRKAVFKVNGTAPDEDGNVNLPTVAGVSSVNGIGADGQGNVNVTLAQLGGIALTGAIPANVNPVMDLDTFLTGICLINSYNTGVLHAPPTVTDPASNWWIIIAVGGYNQLALPAVGNARPRYIRAGGPDPTVPSVLVWSAWSVYNPPDTDPFI